MRCSTWYGAGTKVGGDEAAIHAWDGPAAALKQPLGWLLLGVGWDGVIRCGIRAVFSRQPRSNVGAKSGVGNWLTTDTCWWR